MKTLIPLFLFVLIAATAPSFAQSEKAPDTRPGPMNNIDEEYDLLFEYPCGNATGEAGIETDGTYIYTSLWNGDRFCKYGTDGTYLGAFSIPGVAALRDLAWDGTYFYGTAASSVVFQIDFDNQILIGTITAPNPVRAIACDDWDGFYANNWSSPIMHFNGSGSLISTIPTYGYEAYSGFGFDPWEGYLWGYGQSGFNENTLYKIELPDGSIVEQFDVLNYLSLPTPGTSYSAGLFFCFDILDPIKLTLGGVVFNVCFWGLNLGGGTWPHDVGVQSILSPTSGLALGHEMVTIRVKNHGQDTEVNIPVSFTLNGGEPITGIIPGPLANEQSVDFTFPDSIYLGNPGQSYNLICCTELYYDLNPGNNCKTTNVIHFPPGYCDATTSYGEEHIAHVLFGDINNSSDWQNGVADYTNIFTTLEAGSSEIIQITNGSPLSVDKVTVWVDWNNDTVFSNEINEEYPLANNGGTGILYSGDINVPENIPDGNYRMRIRMTYVTTPVPCGNLDYGEIEDYTINVYNPPQNDVGVYAFLSPTGGPYMGEEIVTIRVKNFGGATQNNIPVYYTLDGGTPVTGVVPGPIAPGQTEDFTFPGTVNLSNPGQSYVFYGCTTLEGDDNPANDCKTMMIVGWPVYCDASTTNQEEYVYWVGCGDIDKYSSWQAGVADYTDISTSLPAGWSEPISVTIENARAGDSVTVWTDWNQDFIFGNVPGEIFPLTDYDGTGHYFDGIITVPEDTPPGEYRMRIRLNYNSTPEPCGVAEFGEIEDYTIFVPAIPENDVGIESLISPPTNISPIGPGNKIVTIRVKNFGSSAQSDIPVSYTLDGGNPINGIIKGPVASGETLDYTFNGFAGLNTLGAAYNFNFCISLEGDENPANDCFSKTINTIWPYYLDGSTFLEDEYIANVLFGSINNSSGWQGNTADYTDLYTIIPAGESETITVTNGKAYPSDIVYVWVDWNNDYRFDHLYGTEEEYHLTNVGGYGEIFTGEIAVPDGQANGNYRMRVRMSYSTPPTPHGDATYGEVEDYTIVVDAVTPPQVRANPGSITQILEPDNTAVQTVALSNVGELPLIFDLSLTSGNKVLKLSQPNNRRQAIDVGLESILSPVSGFNLGEEIISIQVINFGTDAQSNIPVLFCIDDGDTISGIIPGTLNSGDTVNYTFSATGNFSISGQTYCLSACTTLEGDEVTENDCKTGYIVNRFREFCPALTTTQDEYISNVLFGNINNSSGWQDSIAGFTNLSTTIESGTSENIMVTNGLPYNNDLVTAWVDWNKDFDFNSAGEQYILTNQNGTGETFTGEISVPENQPSGDYRLRIRMCYYTEPVPCGGSTYGEVEEYSIHVANNQTIPWLTVEPMMGVVNPNDSTTINVTFDANGLQNGLYEGSIIINSNDPGTPFTTIPVTLLVGQCPLPPPLNPEGYEMLPNMAYLSWQAPDSTGNLLGYNVYRNTEKINPEIVSNLFYEDSLANPSQYFYFITAVYPECEASSDTISLVITNLPEKENDGVRIFPNPAGNFVTIQSEIKISQVTIMNNLGEVVFKIENPGETIRVNTSDFPGGIYLIRLRSFENIFMKKLIIK